MNDLGLNRSALNIPHGIACVVTGIGLPVATYMIEPSIWFLYVVAAFFLLLGLAELGVLLAENLKKRR